MQFMCYRWLPMVGKVRQQHLMESYRVITSYLFLHTAALLKTRRTHLSRFLSGLCRPDLEHACKLCTNGCMDRIWVQRVRIQVQIPHARFDHWLIEYRDCFFLNLCSIRNEIMHHESWTSSKKPNHKNMEHILCISGEQNVKSIQVSHHMKCRAPEWISPHLGGPVVQYILTSAAILPALHLPRGKFTT